MKELRRIDSLAAAVQSRVLVDSQAKAEQSPCQSRGEPGLCTHGSFGSALESCQSFGQLGCLLCWWLVGGWSRPGTDGFTVELFREWTKSSAVQAQSSRARARGATFPIRCGDLHVVEEKFQGLQLTEVCKDEFAYAWSEQAWTYVTLCALNRLAGAAACLNSGRWTLSERRAAESVARSVRVRLSKDASRSQQRETEWRKDMESRHVGYSGEEISTCHALTLQQILPSLPPEEHRGSIDSLDWVGVRTKEFLLYPEKLLLPENEVVLPKLPGKIHMVEKDKGAIARELVKRRVCDWLPLDKVYSVKGQKILNGMFGVVKPSVIEDGSPVLRVIMNLTGSNATQKQLEGGCSGLPAITSWQSIAMDGSEQLRLFQSDMSAAFYLF